MKNTTYPIARPAARLLTAFVFVWLVASCGSGSRQDATAPVSALSTFEIENGFTIELIASEPLISDPVDMEIDEDGRLYVVEMHGYPLDKSGTGKIKLLKDINGDGVMDSSTVFAEGLMLPNSIMRWKKGVIVTDAPNVLYFEDTDGDGRAEIRDTLLTGFALSNPQHNLNTPLLGIDNWIYLGHEGAVGTETYQKEFGDPGRDIYFPRHSHTPRLGTNAGGRSVRFQPDTWKLEMESSHTQFGHTFDAWGHHLLVGNANHIYQEVIPQTYLQRNPHLPISNATQSISDHGEAAEVFPITQNPEHQLLTDVGVITSACGLTAYLGGIFPPPYDSVTFVAEPVSNLVHVDRLKDNGSTFTASRLQEHKEFLASTDAKFRPVNMYIGPDGALYVVDYYRKIIEHPEWMGEDVVKSGELYSDSDKGRIYRITPTGSASPSWTKGIALGKATAGELVDYLASSNIWLRMNAQRLLLDRAGKESIAPLNQMTKNASPMGRLHALWTLEGLHALTPELIEQALKDPVAGIRENAVKLAELHLKDAPALVKPLLSLRDDVNPKVRFQLLSTLGFVNTTESIQARHKLLFKDITDKWVQVAALSASSSQAPALLDEVLNNFHAEIPAYSTLVQRLAAMIVLSGDNKAAHSLLQKEIHAKNQQPWRAALFEGLAEGLENKRQGSFLSETEERQLTDLFFESPSISARKSSYELLKTAGIKSDATANRAIEKAVALSGDPNQPDDKRAAAIDFISLRNPHSRVAFLMKLFVPTEALSIQLAALRTLGSIPDTTVCGYLQKQWPVLTPEIRDAAVAVFMDGPERTAMLLNAIESGKIAAADVSWPRKVGLMAQDDDTLRAQARAIFTSNNDREINKAYQRALELKGDAVKGKAIYQTQCALCHQIRGKMGLTLGPDLGTIHNWSPDAIMANILAPNQSISSGFDLWTVELKNGGTAQGIIVSETPGAITIRNAGTVERTINRHEIKSLKALTMSAMPVGLDKKISVEEMADLLAFLKQNK